MRNWFFLFSLVVVITFSVSAQTTQEEEALIEEINDLSTQLVTTQEPNERERQLDKIISLGEQASTINRQVELLKVVAGKCIQGARYSEALLLTSYLRKIAPQTNDTALALAQVYNLEGVIHHAIGRYSDAVNSYYLSYLLNHPIKDSLLAMYQYNNLANMYLYQNKAQEAKPYYYQAFRFPLTKKNRSSYFQIAYNMAELYNKENNLDSMRYFISVMDSLWKTNTLDNTYYYMMQLRKSKWEIRTKKYDQAQNILNNIIAYYFSKKELSKANDAINQLADLLQELNSSNALAQLLTYTERLLNQSKDISIRMDAFRIRSECFKQMKKYSQALQMKDSLLHYKELFFEKKMDEDLVAANLVNEMQLKERQINLLQKEKELQDEVLFAENQKYRFAAFGIIGLLVAVAFLVLFLLKIKGLNHALKESKRDLEQKNDIIVKNNQRLKKLSELNTRIFSLSSHDIRAPLNSIYFLMKAFWDKRKEKLSLNEQEVLKNFDHGMEKIYHLIDMISSWSASFHQSSMQSERIHFDLFKLSPLVDDVLAIYEPLAKSKQLLMINQIDEQWEIATDYHLLHGILRNLVHNSIKFTDKGGLISVSALVIEEKLRLCIRDSGSGKEKKSEKEEGLGIALELIQEILDNFDGQLGLMPNPKKGMDAILLIPLQDHKIPAIEDFQEVDES